MSSSKCQVIKAQPRVDVTPKIRKLSESRVVGLGDKPVSELRSRRLGHIFLAPSETFGRIDGDAPSYSRVKRASDKACKCLGHGSYWP